MNSSERTSRFHFPEGQYAYMPSTVRPYRLFFTPTSLPSPIAEVGGVVRWSGAGAVKTLHVVNHHNFPNWIPNTTKQYILRASYLGVRCLTQSGTPTPRLCLRQQAGCPPTTGGECGGEVCIQNRPQKNEININGTDHRASNRPRL